ncbi:hypothetical protein EYR41_000025 [Orbilia oligospora]|uniref:Rhodopsin domain-containing protein n=1 Tax=Orbilia oligospora TaxID=2813651 RepID=A0A7C8PG20_ORBOL|nr:hypothetical protein TWF751_006505 [Orbilia oligospora]TGJ72898.1 hypothetical protein EYR41_000025 [Orbilia oligospora]
MYTPASIDEYVLLGKIIERLNGAAVFKSIPKTAMSEGYVPPDKGNIVFIVATISMAVALVLVGGRLYTRKIYSGKLGLDDWMIIPAMILTLGFTAVQILAVKNAHMGMHVYDISPYAMVEGTKLTYAHMILYVYSIMFTKLSIILFIRRLSFDKMWHICNGFFAFHVLFGIASSLALAFQCKPIAAAYDLLTKLEHQCNALTMYYAITSIGVASDIALLFLPAPIVFKLQLPLWKKIAVLFLFSLGGLACIFAILRMIHLLDGVRGIDLTWDIVPVALYGQLEVTLAIIATSLPALKVLWKGWLPRLSNSINSRMKRSNHSEHSGGSGEAHNRYGSLAKTGTIEISVTDRRPSGIHEDIEMGGGIAWRTVEFGNGIPPEPASMVVNKTNSRDGNGRDRTPLSTADGALLDVDERIFPIPPTRSRQNSRATSEISAESDVSLGNWINIRNNSFAAVGTPLSPMPQLPQATYDRPRKDSEVVVRW